MSTFVGAELPSGNEPSTLYAPDRLDVDQWVSLARDTGMKYAVLTTKHVAGHSLWPTRYNDYHVGTSGNKTDVVAAFLQAMRSAGALNPDFTTAPGTITTASAPLSPNLAPLPLRPGASPEWQELGLCDSSLPGFPMGADHRTDGALRPDRRMVARHSPPASPRLSQSPLRAYHPAAAPDAVVMYNHGIGDGDRN